jgi:hypothetical protein
MIDPIIEHEVKKIHAHTVTFPELLKAQHPVITLQGQLVGGPDRRYDDARVMWVEWQKSIQHASKTVGVVRPEVMDYFQATKHLSRPPKKGDVAGTQDKLLDFKYLPKDDVEEAVLVDITKEKAIIPPRFTWSYTSMQEFLTCPAQWAAKRYYKTIKDVESEAMCVGNLIHETAEHYLKRAIGQTFLIDKIHSQYLPMVQKYCDALVASGADLQMEKEMCFDNKMKVSGWWAKDVWVRAKGDVLAKKAQRLSIVDWKSGKYKEDFLQLKLFAVLSALTPGFEDVTEFDPKFIFLKEDVPKNILRMPEPIKRSELKPVLTEILAVVRRMEAAWESENFPCKKNGLCKAYCANKECAHCGSK